MSPLSSGFGPLVSRRLTPFWRIALFGSVVSTSLAVGTAHAGTALVSPNSSNSLFSVSADGTKVVFTSSDETLVPGDTNGQPDIFVRDRTTGVTTRVSVASDGTQSDLYSNSPSISADGTRVAFISQASNLIVGQTTSFTQVFVHDLTTGKTTLASVDSNGVAADGYCYSAVISADGNRVAFQDGADNLVAGDTNNTFDIFVHDLTTGVTQLGSLGNGRVLSDGFSANPSLSADGTKVAFESHATNLVDGDTNGQTDIFVHDLTTGVTKRVTVASDGTQSNLFSSFPTLSADGTKVSFDSYASNLVADDSNGVQDVFFHNIATGETTRVSVASNGAQGSGDSSYNSLSADGTRVAFSSYASNLVSGDTNGTSDVFVRDLTTGVTTRLSTDNNGVQGNDYSGGPSLSADGTKVVYTSGASNLVPGDTNGKFDVFISDAVTPALSINDTTVNEGNSGTSNAVFTVTLSNSSVVPVSVQYAVTPITANAADLGTASDSDGGTPGILNIPAGSKTGTITVPVKGDLDIEGDDVFTVNLSNPSGATIADNFGVGIITNDDIAPIIHSVKLEAAPTSAGPFAAVAPKTNDTLRATVVASDANSETLLYSYVWKVGGVTRQSTLGVTSETDTFDLSLVGNGDKGQTVSVTVSVSDGDYTVNKPAVNTTVANSAPVVKPIELTTWRLRSVLSRPDATDADGDALTFTYPGTPGSAGGSITYTPSSDGLFLYTPPSTLPSATTEVSNFSVSDGTASTPSTITAQLTSLPANVKRYSAVGASDVQGYGASDYDLSKVTFSPAKSYAPLLVQNDKLGSRYPGMPLSRRGVNGFTVFDALNRSVGGQTMVSLANSDNARAISLWYGPNDVLTTLVPLLINNLGTTPDGSGLNAVTTNWLNSWRPTYTAVANSLRTSTPQVKVVAVGTPDLGPGLSALVAQRLGLDSSNPAQAQVIGRISTAITRAITGTTQTTGENGINAHIASLNLPYVDLVNDTDITTGGNVDSSLQYQPTDLAADGFHPNDSGYAKLATRLWRLFDPLLNHLPIASNATKVVAQNSSTSGQLVASDFENSPLAFAKVNGTGPSHGTLVLNSNGSYTYTPDAGYIGTDSFIYRVFDGTDYSDTATVSFTVREFEAPTIALTSPTLNQKLLIADFTGDVISGTASDNVGVTSVKVRLSRKRGTVNEYWNGTDWAATSTLLSATMTPASATSVTWTLNGQLPPASKLDSGLYNVQVSAQDAAGNKSAYVNGSFSLSGDQVAPTLAISTPTANQKVLIANFAVSGTASDDTAVTAVKVRLSRKRGTTNTYWNGTDFVTASTSLVDAQINGSTWSLGASTPPAGKLDTGAYLVEAYALDASNNKSTTAKVAFTLNSDFEAPTVAIVTPTSSQVININNFGAGTIKGSAADNIGVTSVKLKLQRKRNNVFEYWNGTAFTPTVALVDATYNSTTGDWSYDSAIPASALDAGGYTVYATAYDAAGNFKTSSSRAFSINGTPSASDAFSAPTSRSAGSS